MMLAPLLLLALPLATEDPSGGGAIGNNFVPLIVALIGGSLAALVTGYFTRPKTKAEAEQANASAQVSLSADAREWARIWMKRSEDAEIRAASAEDRAEAAEIEARAAHVEATDAREQANGVEGRVEDLEETIAAYMVWSRTLVAEIERLKGHVEDPPIQVMRWHEGQHRDITVSKGQPPPRKRKGS